MKSRHAAALALVGWYLITPPFVGNNRMLKPNAPLSQWDVLYILESYSECQETRREFATEDDPGMVLNAEKISYLCVAADDPRLEQK